MESLMLLMVSLAMVAVSLVGGVALGFWNKSIQRRRIERQREFVFAWEDYVERWESGGGQTSAYLRQLAEHRKRLDYERAKLAEMERALACGGRRAGGGNEAGASTRGHLR